MLFSFLLTQVVSVFIALLICSVFIFIHWFAPDVTVDKAELVFNQQN